MMTDARICAAVTMAMLAGTSCFAQLIGHWALDGDAIATLGTNGTAMNVRLAPPIVSARPTAR